MTETFVPLLVNWGASGLRNLLLLYLLVLFLGCSFFLCLYSFPYFGLSQMDLLTALSKSSPQSCRTLSPLQQFLHDFSRPRFLRPPLPIFFPGPSSESSSSSSLGRMNQSADTPLHNPTSHAFLGLPLYRRNGSRVYSRRWSFREAPK
jgi:hypothetical protein